MKTLFISTLSQEGMFGGDVCSKRNYDSVQSILGIYNVILYSLKPPLSENISLLLQIKMLLQRIKEIFQGYMLGINKRKIKEILQLIENENISLVFLDSSLLGSLAKKIKKNNSQVKIITFFHNTELKFLYDSIIIDKRVSRLFWIILAFYNERTSCKYSDHLIALNTRDAKLIYKLYKTKVNTIIPISLENNFSQMKSHNNILNKTKTALFVGSYFYANSHGITWFIDNVMPKVSIKLLIVGKNMDQLKLKNKWKDFDIEIHSNVPELSLYYSIADFVIMPLFSGSGMKVKTAEALMYGKYILGTNEAFEGYEINNLVGEHCNNAIEFIDAINKYDGKNKISSFSKKLFDEKYSFETTLISFKEVIGNL